MIIKNNNNPYNYRTSYNTTNHNDYVNNYHIYKVNDHIIIKINRNGSNGDDDQRNDDNDDHNNNDPNKAFIK